MNPVSTSPRWKFWLSMICRMQRDRGLDRGDVEFAEGALHRGDRFGAGGAVDDQLADHAVVVRRDAVAGVGVGVDPHAGAAGEAEFLDQAGTGGEVARGVLGVDPALDRVADLLERPSA